MFISMKIIEKQINFAKPVVWIGQLIQPTTFCVDDLNQEDLVIIAGE